MPTKEMLSIAGVKGGKAFKHRWTEEERDIVRRDYKGTNLSAQVIAAMLSRPGNPVTQYAVKGQAAALGLMQQKSPPWTQREIECLQSLIHQYSIPQIAKKLHRSANAVKIKATRLKLGLRQRDDWYTKREGCEICGVDHKIVQRWIDSGALAATWHNGRKPQKNGSNMWHITTNALRRFLIMYSGELLGRNVDIQQIVWIVAGSTLIHREPGGGKM